MSFERVFTILAIAFVLAACHREVEQVPLVDDKITRRDRFFDVATRDGETVWVVGYGGKILRSGDGGTTWEWIRADTDKALMRIAFADDERGWIVGQDGLVLRTDDGGTTWALQDSGTSNHLFGLSVISRERVFASGDRSWLAATADGGQTWSGSAVALSDVGMDPDIAMAVQEPIYYDVFFLDAHAGWMVGDYGNIRVTSDGGRTWDAQHGSLLGQQIAGYLRPLRDALDMPALFRVRMQDRERGFVAGVGGILAATSDGGETWSFVDPKVSPPVDAPLLEIVFPQGRPLLLGGSASVLELDDGRWRRGDLGLPILTWFVAADFAETGPGAGRRGFTVGGRGMILRTDDGGREWRPVGSAMTGVS